MVTSWTTEGLEFESREGKEFSPYRPDRMWGSLSLLSNGSRGFVSWLLSGRGVKLTTHLQLVPRTRKTVITVSTPAYVFIAQCLVS
jgi:hypothetical protein